MGVWSVYSLQERKRWREDVESFVERRWVSRGEEGELQQRLRVS